MTTITGAPRGLDELDYYPSGTYFVCLLQADGSQYASGHQSGRRCRELVTLWKSGAVLDLDGTEFPIRLPEGRDGEVTHRVVRAASIAEIWVTRKDWKEPAR